MELIIIGIIIVVVVVFIAMTIKIVPQQRVGVVERLGKFHRLLTPGLNILIPVIDQVRVYHDLRIQQANVPPQTVITKDNVQVQIDTIIFYQVVGPEEATYGISDYVYGVRNISTATMRQIIGKLELDETLSGREKSPPTSVSRWMKRQRSGACALSVSKLSTSSRRSIFRKPWTNR